MISVENAGEIGLPAADEREAALYRRLAALSIAWTTHAHVPVFTVEDARAARVGHLPGTHTKNLFLESKKGGLFLIVAREDLRLDLSVARALGVSRFSFGNAEGAGGGTRHRARRRQPVCVDERYGASHSSRRRRRNARAGPAQFSSLAQRPHHGDRRGRPPALHARHRT